KYQAGEIATVLCLLKGGTLWFRQTRWGATFCCGSVSEPKNSIILNVSQSELKYLLLLYCIQLNHSSVPQIACRQKVPGGRLASVHNLRANTDLVSIVKKCNFRQWSVWLGAMRLYKSNRFIWTDGSRWNFQKWAPGEPNNLWNNENCVESYIQYTGNWNDIPCEALRPFICAFKSGSRRWKTEKCWKHDTAWLIKITQRMKR
uniref:C-type lectin domain-containing protein n=1 Tax=Paramormyrops kingsleyae TaxID=1676925 RepID=A0A3B3S0A0_9TELE